MKLKANRVIISFSTNDASSDHKWNELIWIWGTLYMAWSRWNVNECFSWHFVKYCLSSKFVKKFHFLFLKKKQQNLTNKNDIKNIFFYLFTAEARLPHDIVAPRSIQDLPEKLLTSGIYLPGTFASCVFVLQFMFLIICFKRHTHIRHVTFVYTNEKRRKKTVVVFSQK